MNNSHKLSTDQRGIMAIVVTVLIMTVLSITTLAMAKMARREQRQSLDATMSVQANYAVESGTNDSLQYLNKPSPVLPTTCTTVGSANALTNTMTIPSFISTELGGYTVTTSYTCALVSDTATTLNYTVTDTKSSVANINVSGANSLTISWESTDGSSIFRPDPCAQSLPTSWVNASGSPFTPMLRVDITNLSGGFSRASMASNTGTFYLNSCITGTVNPTFASGYGAGNPQIINGSCAAATKPRKCTATINGITIAGINYTKLLVRLHSVYGGAANVSIVVNNPLGGSPLPISGAQATIDVTAKSTDVVKRVRQSYPLTAESRPYLYAIESQNAICKRLRAGLYDATYNRDGTDFESANVGGNDHDVCSPT